MNFQNVSNRATDHPDESQTLSFKSFWDNLCPTFYDMCTMLYKWLKKWMMTIYAQNPRVLQKCVRYVGRHLKSLFIWGDFQFHSKTWLVTGQTLLWGCSWPRGGRFLTSLCLDDTTFISPGLDPLEWTEIGLFFLKYNSRTLHVMSSLRAITTHSAQPTFLGHMGPQ